MNQYPSYGYPAPPAKARMGAGAIVAIFIGVLLGLGALAAIYILASAPAAPQAPCPPQQPCAPRPTLPPISQASPTATSSLNTPAPATSVPATLAPGATPIPFVPPTVAPGTPDAAVVNGKVWRSETLGYSFEYDPELFTLAESDDGLAIFSGVFFDAQIIVHGVSAATPPADLIEQELAVVDRLMIGRVRDKDDYDALLGPSIGYVRGEGNVYSGTLVGSDGTPVAPGGVTVLAASDGRLTIAIVIIVGQPDLRLGGDTHQHAVRSATDEFLKTFDWGGR